MCKNLFFAVVLFYPDFNAIRRCIKHKKEYGVEIVVWDNTPGDLQSKEYVKLLVAEDIVVLGEGENVGLGRSINKLSEWALCNEYHWVLTLDQDSFVEKLDYIFLETIKKEEVAWIGTIEHTRKLRLSGKLISIQSGSILSPQILLNVGGFKSDLFIDHADHEICLRLQNEGYAVYRQDIVRIKHCLGEQQMVLGFSYSGHNLNRTRYFVRNGFYCVARYPEYSLYFFPQVVKEIAKQLLRGRVEIFFTFVKDAINGLRSKLGVII